MKWINFFQQGLNEKGTDGIIPAETLGDRILKHDGSEAYHCAFDLVEEELELTDTGVKTVAKYKGTHRGALGYYRFDFDSSDGGVRAHQDAKAFITDLQLVGCQTYFSGSKGFHVEVPASLFALEPNPKLGKQLHAIATQLKKKYPSLDTTVFNPQRKFRALGTLHPKTGLYKIKCDLNEPLELIQQRAVNPGDIAVEVVQSYPINAQLAALSSSQPKDSAQSQESISHDEWRRYRQPDGARARKECLFLKHCDENPSKISEPEWYAAASIVGRFKDGRAQFHAMSKGHPAYDSEKTDSKLEQALQASGPRTCKAIGELWGGCLQCPHFERLKSPVVILEKEVIPTEATGFYLLWKDGDKTKRTPDYVGLCDAFKRDFKYFRDSRTDKTYAWNGTHYADVTQTDLLAWCEQVMEPKPLQKVRNEFKHKIEANCVKPQSEIESFFFDTTKGKLNLKNGILDVATGSLYPHDDRIGFRYTLPYEYDPKALCPAFDKFLDEVTLSRKDLQRTLVEFMAYCLWPSYDDHSFLWLAGGGRNGKSTFMEIVQRLVGKDNWTAVLLAEFEKPGYIQTMDHKLVNISEESDSFRIEPEIIGTLKALSSGAHKQVDQKYEVSYAMRATAKLIFSANRPPIFPSTEDALKSRMIVVPFDLQLEKHGEDATESKIDWTLKERLFTEMPGILNRCISALRDFALRTPRKIFRSAVTHHAMNEIMRDSDPVEAWVQDYVKLGGEKLWTLPDLFAHFQRTQDKDLKMQPGWFSRKLRARLGAKCFAPDKRIGGIQTRMFTGFTLISDTVGSDEAFSKNSEMPRQDRDF